jgi:hypothetical protein
LGEWLSVLQPPGQTVFLSSTSLFQVSGWGRSKFWSGITDFGPRAAVLVISPLHFASSLQATVANRDSTEFAASDRLCETALWISSEFQFTSSFMAKVVRPATKELSASDRLPQTNTRTQTGIFLISNQLFVDSHRFASSDVFSERSEALVFTSHCVSSGSISSSIIVCSESSVRHPPGLFLSRTDTVASSEADLGDSSRFAISVDCFATTAYSIVLESPLISSDFSGSERMIRSDSIDVCLFDRKNARAAMSDGVRSVVQSGNGSTIAMSVVCILTIVIILSTVFVFILFWRGRDRESTLPNDPEFDTDGNVDDIPLDADDHEYMNVLVSDEADSIPEFE